MADVQKEVKMLQSLAMAVLDKDGNPVHVQIVIGQYVDSGQMVCYFDVVDPSKIKLQDEVHSSDNN